MTEDEKAEQDPRTKYVPMGRELLPCRVQRWLLCSHCGEELEVGEDALWIPDEGIFHKDCVQELGHVQEFQNPRADFREKA